MTRKKFLLKLKGKTCVFIDWANVHGWAKSLKRLVDTRKLFKYLRGYKEVSEIKFYYGTDKHPKSKQFVRSVKRIGYSVVTKPVKHILAAVINGKEIYKRKCDFDMEISLDVHASISKFESFIFFSGDGDFEPLYRFLLKLKKQVIVIYAHGHLGREVYELKQGLYKKAVDAMGADLFVKKMPPRLLEGRD